MKIYFTFIFMAPSFLLGADYQLNNKELSALLNSYNKCVGIFNEVGLNALVEKKCLSLEAKERKAFRGLQSLAHLQFNSGYFVFFKHKPLLAVKLQDLLNQEVALPSGETMGFLSPSLISNHESLSDFLSHSKIIKERERSSVALSYLLFGQMLRRAPEVILRAKSP